MHLVSYESFLLEQNDEISLHAMTMFTEWQCRPEQLVVVNQFANLESKWKTEKFFRPRIENFHGCKLWIDFMVETDEDKEMDIYMPFLGIYQSKNKSFFPEGAIIDMLDALSTQLNFTYFKVKLWRALRIFLSAQLCFRVWTIDPVIQSIQLRM